MSESEIPVLNFIGGTPRDGYVGLGSEETPIVTEIPTPSLEETILEEAAWKMDEAYQIFADLQANLADSATELASAQESVIVATEEAGKALADAQTAYNEAIAAHTVASTANDTAESVKVKVDEAAVAAADALTASTNAQTAADEAAQAAAVAAGVAAEAKTAAESAATQASETVVDTTIEYALSSSETDPPTTGWTASTVTRTPGNFIWMRSVLRRANETTSISSPVLVTGNEGVPGEQGEQGIPGENGADGVSLHTWLKYADSPTSGMSDDPTGKTYIGLAYNKISSTESSNYADYTWSLVKGADGARGEDGADGSPRYTWIKYATSSTGANMSDDPTGKTYIGLAHNQLTAIESTTASDYTWALIQGPKGDPGSQGIQGPKGKDGSPTYIWLKYADSPTSGMSDSPTGKMYMGLAHNQLTPTESLNYSDYSWSLIKGTDGVAGPKGDDGQTTYTWVKYATSNTGANMSDDPTGKTYIGLAHNKPTSVESTTASDYTWALIQGAKGADGISITAVTPMFIMSASTPTPPPGNSGWATTEPAPVAGQSLWRVEKITYSNNSTAYTTPTKVSSYTIAVNAQEAADQAAQDAASAATLAGSKADVLIQSAAPAVEMRKASTLWIDTTNNLNTPKRWNGSSSSWAVITDKAAVDAANVAADAKRVADKAAADLLTAKSDLDALEARALNLENRANTLEGSITTIDGKVSIKTVAPTTQNGQGKPVGAMWYVRPTGSSTYTSVWEWSGSAWTKTNMGTDFLSDDAVTNAKIADFAVDSAQIKDAAIATAKIADAAITTLKVADGAIGTAKIGNAAITNAKIGDAAVDTAQIRDLAVTSAKITSLDVGKLTADVGTFNVAVINKLMSDSAFLTNLYSSSVLVTPANLIRDPNFRDPTLNAWRTQTISPASASTNQFYDTSLTKYYFQVVTTPNSYNSVRLSLTAAPNTVGTPAPAIPVESGEKYRFAAKIRLTNSTSTSNSSYGSLVVRWFRSNGYSSAGTSSVVATPYINTTDSGWVDMVQEVTAPAYAAYATVELVVASFHEKVNFMSPSFMKMVGSVLIENGAITATKVNADVFNAREVNSWIINGSTINSTTLNSATIYSPTINAGTLNSVDINSGTVTGALIQSESAADRGVKFTSTGLKGYNQSGGLVFNLDSSSGNLSLAGDFSTEVGDVYPRVDIKRDIWRDFDGIRFYVGDTTMNQPEVKVNRATWGVHPAGTLFLSSKKTTSDTQWSEIILGSAGEITIDSTRSVRIVRPTIYLGSNVSSSSWQAVEPLFLDNYGRLYRWTNAPQRPIVGTNTLASGTTITPSSYASITVSYSDTGSTPRIVLADLANHPGGSANLVPRVVSWTSTSANIRIINTGNSNATLNAALIVRAAVIF